RAQIGSIMIPAALTAFATGITEPVEFAFIFVAPALYAVHIVLTGVSMAILNALDAHLGFGFSAGLLDLLLNATKDNTTGLGAILLLAVCSFYLSFGVFYVLITKFNLPPPGREADSDDRGETVGARTKTDRDEDPGSGDSPKGGADPSD